MNSENMSGLEKVLRDTLAWIDWIPNTMLIKLFHGLKEQCEALNIDSVFKVPFSNHSRLINSHPLDGHCANGRALRKGP